MTTSNDVSRQVVTARPATSINTHYRRTGRWMWGFMKFSRQERGPKPHEWPEILLNTQGGRVRQRIRAGAWIEKSLVLHQLTRVAGTASGLVAVWDGNSGAHNSLYLDRRLT